MSRWRRCGHTVAASRSHCAQSRSRGTPARGPAAPTSRPRGGPAAPMSQSRGGDVATPRHPCCGPAAATSRSRGGRRTVFRLAGARLARPRGRRMRSRDGAWGSRTWRVCRRRAGPACKSAPVLCRVGLEIPRRATRLSCAATPRRSPARAPSCGTASSCRLRGSSTPNRRLAATPPPDPPRWRRGAAADPRAPPPRGRALARGVDAAKRVSRERAPGPRRRGGAPNHRPRTRRAVARTRAAVSR